MSILGILTFGALGAYAEVMRYRYIYSHTVINGRRLKFKGSWTDLFLLNFKWGFFSVITLGIYLIWRMTRKQEWVTSNVTVEDAPDEATSRFTASVGGNFGNALGWGLLSIITFGLCSFMAHAHRNRYITTHSVISDGTLNYTVTGPKYFGKCVVWFLLSLITFGIYSIWVMLRSSQYEVANTNFNDPAAVPIAAKTVWTDAQSAAAAHGDVYTPAAPSADRFDPHTGERIAFAESIAETAAAAAEKQKKEKKPFSQVKVLKIAILTSAICALALMTIVPLLGGAFAGAFSLLAEGINPGANGANPSIFYLEKLAYQYYRQAFGVQIFALIAAVPLAVLVFMRKFEKNWIASGVFTAVSLVEVILWIVGFSGAVGAYKNPAYGMVRNLNMPFLQTLAFVVMLLALLLQTVLFALRFAPQLKSFIDSKKNGTPLATQTEPHGEAQERTEVRFDPTTGARISQNDDAFGASAGKDGTDRAGKQP